MNINKNNNQGGYAILFTVVMVSIISVIVIGLSNTTYKQLLLSSVAKDSQIAFYNSDTATECALFADNVANLSAYAMPMTWECGIDNTGATYTMDVTAPLSGDPGFEMNPVSSWNTSLNPCFRISVIKSVPQLITDPIVTTVSSSGYNICNKSNPKTVERTIQVVY